MNFFMPTESETHSNSDSKDGGKAVESCIDPMIPAVPTPHRARELAGQHQAEEGAEQVPMERDALHEQEQLPAEGTSEKSRWYTRQTAKSRVTTESSVKRMTWFKLVFLLKALSLAAMIAAPSTLSKLSELTGFSLSELPRLPSTTDELADMFVPQYDLTGEPFMAPSGFALDVQGCAGQVDGATMLSPEGFASLLCETLITEPREGAKSEPKWWLPFPFALAVGLKLLV